MPNPVTAVPQAARLAVALCLLVPGGCEDTPNTPSPTNDADVTGSETSVDAAPADLPGVDVVPTDVPSEETSTPVPVPGFECAAQVLEAGAVTPTGVCIETLDAPAGIQAATIEATCTDPNINALVEKRHLIMLPPSTPRGTLWVHFGGSGGKPANNKNIGEAAALEGYHFISLAYPNEPSIADRCTCPAGPRGPSCEEKVRAEILYGIEVTPWFDMDNSEAILPRLKALLVFLATEQPGKQWNDFLTSAGELVWSKVAVSGFSQGGGMAGLLARDHAVDRAMYLSKGAGSTSAAMVDGALVQPCTAHDQCGEHRCCPFSALDCETPGADAYCQVPVPIPSAWAGKDLDGDGLGEGPVTSRATAPARQFALVHRDEGAWGYSPQLFEAWAMGAPESFVDADAASPPFGDAQLFSTGLAPKGASCSEHQSMGADGCQPNDPATGRPAMEPVWRHIMGKVF